MPAPGPPSTPGGVLAALRSPAQLRRELLAALVTSLALIPEVISFSIVAGVDPKVGLFGACVLSVVMAVLGGRPAMITAAAGSVALVVGPLNREHGLGYLLAAFVLAGVIQVVLGLLGVARLMRFLPRSVMIGFVNALAILIFSAQLPQVVGEGWLVWLLVIGAILIIVSVPRVQRVIPSQLIAIAVLTAITVPFALHVPRVGEEGSLPRSLPTFGLPEVPLSLDTLTIIAPYALAAALVGLMESLLTAKLVDDLTDTGSSKTREAWSLGVANIAAPLFGGLGGCAMIGQTMINVKDGHGRTRISTGLAGVFVLVLTVAFGDLVGQIPMAALVAVMIVVAATTFDWHSVRPATLRRMPKSETAAMVITVLATVSTANLAIGVGVGFAAAAVLFVRRVAHLAVVERELDTRDGDPVARYRVSGELFFASSNDLYTQFRYADDPPTVEIDLSASHVWDASSVAALDSVQHKYAQHGVTVSITGLDPPSTQMIRRLSGTLG